MSDGEPIRVRGQAAPASNPAPSMQQLVIRHAQADMAALPAEKPMPAEPASQAPAKAKIGAEHAKSMLKLGFHELTAALVALPDSNLRPLEEPGVFGNEHMPHIRSNAHAVASPEAQDRDRTPCP